MVNQYFYYFTISKYILKCTVNKEIKQKVQKQETFPTQLLTFGSRCDVVIELITSEIFRTVLVFQSWVSILKAKRDASSPACRASSSMVGAGSEENIA